MNDGIGFLINDTARLFRRELDRRIRSIGVTALQWRALASIARYDGIIQSQLAELLEVEPITLSRMIDRLTEAGLVTRLSCPDDRRANRLHLTDRAQPLVAEVRAHANVLIDDALTGLSAQAVDQLAGYLNLIRSNLSNRIPNNPDDRLDHIGTDQ